ncbi:MAG: hypothetical protein P8M30_02545 [Planctomycetaceae bacterium]|nr:hypothetical protein [Planctomycetaceae bacterium]MDG2388176.1 hypothetical protein [Planctomycetaceae bacterium]
MQTFCYLSFVLAVMSGCASMPGLFGEKVKFTTIDNPATEVICLWEPSEGKAPDGKPSRGFEGTLLFFDSKRSNPVGVHGEVTISVHDDYGVREDWNKPISEFTFSTEEWDQFISRSTFGTSYRIFIPYTRKHPFQVKTSLSVKFVPDTDGSEFYSKMSHVVLPGPLREGVNPDLAFNAELRDRSPENLQQFVAESLTAEQKKPRIDTIHSWNPGQLSAASQSTNLVQLSNHQVTHGQPKGEILRLSESETGADAESWGSTPPALFSSTEESLERDQEPVRRRYKLSP